MSRLYSCARWQAHFNRKLKLIPRTKQIRRSRRLIRAPTTWLIRGSPSLNVKCMRLRQSSRRERSWPRQLTMYWSRRVARNKILQRLLWSTPTISFRPTCMCLNNQLNAKREGSNKSQKTVALKTLYRKVLIRTNCQQGSRRNQTRT